MHMCTLLSPSKSDPRYSIECLSDSYYIVAPIEHDFGPKFKNLANAYTFKYC